MATMTICYSPSLSEEPRNKPIKVFPLIQRESLLSWLERTGRFHTSEIDELQDHKISEDLDDILEPENYVLEDDEEQLD